MPFEIRPAYDVSLEDQADLFTRAFAGYVAGSIEMTPATLARFLGTHTIDLWLSSCLVVDGQLAGFGYINRTGDVSRLAAMGIVPSARNRGAAGFLLRGFLTESKARGDRLMVLEVFEQNPAALALYRRHGFRQVDRLFGWRRGAFAAAATTTTMTDHDIPLVEISPLDAALTSSRVEYPDLPWQASRHAITKLTPGSFAFRASGACVVISNASPEHFRFQTLFPSTEALDDPWKPLPKMVVAVMRRFPDRPWHAPAFFPERYGEAVFRPLGFAREPLNQLLMRREP